MELGTRKVSERPINHKRQRATRLTIRFELLLAAATLSILVIGRECWREIMAQTDIVIVVIDILGIQLTCWFLSASVRNDHNFGAISRVCVI